MTPIVPQAQAPQAMTGEARIIRGNALDLPLADCRADGISRTFVANPHRHGDHE